MEAGGCVERREEGVFGEGNGGVEYFRLKKKKSPPKEKGCSLEYL